MNPSQKENQREQTYFRLSVERRCHSSRPDTGYAGTGCASPGCTSPSGRQQDPVAGFYHREGEEDQQEAPQENDCRQQQQRQTRFQVNNDGDKP